MPEQYSVEVKYETSEKKNFGVRFIVIVLVGILTVIGCGGKKKKAALWPLALIGSGGATGSGSNSAGGNSGTSNGSNGGMGTGSSTEAGTGSSANQIIYKGKVSLLETSVLNPGNSGTFYGQALDVAIVFLASTDLPSPTKEEQPNSVLGCKAWEYTPTQSLLAAKGKDEGQVQITVTGSSPPSFPTCNFDSNYGYLCKENATFDTGGVISNYGPGTASFTDNDINFNASNSTGKYIRISGASNSTNNGSFPIVGLSGANTIIFSSNNFVAETLPPTATHYNVGGFSGNYLNSNGYTIQSVTDPGFLNNNANAEFSLTSSGGNHFTSFTSTTNANNVGQEFYLDNLESRKLNAIPLDGTSFNFSCAPGSCLTGSASHSILNIETTDSSIAGMSPFAMPIPTIKKIIVRCETTSASITVPASYSALIQTSGATRIRTTFMRVREMTGGLSNVRSISGHALVGHTSVP